jgi:hypothetical protein
MLVIENVNISALTARCKTDFDYILCGAVTGKRHKSQCTINSFILLENEIAEKQGKMFLISAQQYSEVERLAEEKEEELLGFFYSSSDNIMREPEIKYAIPGLFYLAVCTQNSRPEIKAWHLSENRKKFQYVNIEILPEILNLTSQLAVAI